MRVLVTRRPSTRADERGAVAVTVALMMVVLVGIGAFTIDFGLRYVSARQLQTASDAAALAAAREFVAPRFIGQTCATIIGDAPARAAAQAKADAIRLENRPGSTSSPIAVSCNADGALDVTVTSSGSTPTVLGPVLGRSADYQDTLPATATVSVPPGASNVRPYAICSKQIPSTLSQTVVKFSLPDPSSPDATSCPTAEIGGNWWTINCPEDGNSNDMGNNTQYGCDVPLEIVRNQPNPTTPTALSSFLQNACPTASDSTSTPPPYSCLLTDTGNVRGTPIISVWSQFALNNTSIIVPVFCGDPSPCSPAGITNPSGGGNVIYPIYRFMALTICGYHWGNGGTSPDSYMSSGVCANNPNGYVPSTGDANDNYFLAVPTEVITSGSIGAYRCPLGDPTCDGGLRRVLLTR